MNKYEYGYMRKQAAIDNIATLYTAMKGILRVKIAGRWSDIDSEIRTLGQRGSADEIAQKLHALNKARHEGAPQLLSKREEQYLSSMFGQRFKGKGIDDYFNPYPIAKPQPVSSVPATPQASAPSFPGHTPLQGSPKQINPALSERLQTVKDLGGLEHIKQLQGDNAAVAQIRSTAGQGPVGGSGMTRQDFIDNEAAANERKNQAQEKLQRHKARVDAATAAQANGTAEVPPAQPQDQPQPQPQPQPDTNKAQARVDAATAAQANGTAEVPPAQPQPQPQPNKLGYGSMALRGGAAAGGAVLGGGLGYGAARGLGLYNEDAGTGKRMLGHLLTAGGAIGGGIGGYYGGSALDKYLASRRAAK